MLHDLISDRQFGFRSGHSTCDQLLITYDEITSSVDSGSAVDLIFFDYSKAFDKVSHSVLLDKLALIGVRECLLHWIRVFLTQRTMQVRIAGALSRPQYVASGVPQGSVLGPTLFLIYVNHIVSYLNCKFMIFADDIKLYLAHSNDIQSSQDTLQRDISTLGEEVRGGFWCGNNRRTH